jgi:hypothetical protein
MKIYKTGTFSIMTILKMFFDLPYEITTEIIKKLPDVKTYKSINTTCVATNNICKHWVWPTLVFRFKNLSKVNDYIYFFMENKMNLVVNLSWCRLITDDGCRALSNCHTVNLSWCYLITNEGCRALSNCHIVNLSWCQLITDEGCRALSNCHTVDLSWCQLVTDEGCRALSNCHTNNLSHCKLITDEGCRALSNCHTVYCYSDGNTTL